MTLENLSDILYPFYVFGVGLVVSSPILMGLYFGSRDEAKVSGIKYKKRLEKS